MIPHCWTESQLFPNVLGLCEVKMKALLNNLNVQTGAMITTQAYSN